MFLLLLKKYQLYYKKIIPFFLFNFNCLLDLWNTIFNIVKLNRFLQWNIVNYLERIEN
jgi:hypothetical protein